MMKTVVRLLLITLLIFSGGLTKVNAANTLADLKKELQQAKNEYAAANAGKQKTESEINAKFRYCDIVIFGNELVIYAYFENRRFFLDVDNMVLS